MGHTRKPRLYGRLTPLAVRRLSKAGYYCDGAGLYLHVSNSGARSWAFRFVLHGRRREMGLGSAATFDLADARERARKCRQLVHDGIDPIEQRRAELAQRAAEAGQRKTFEEAAEQYIELHRAGWRNAKHAEQWRNTLRTYAYPTIGKRDVSSIGRADVLRILEPIWLAKTETASRLRQRIRAVLDWSQAKGWRAAQPGLWDEIDRALPKAAKVKQRSHFAACPYADVPAVLATVRASSATVLVRLAFELTVLAAARSGEVRGMTWQEVDGAVWTVPAQRMKSGRQHRVPLPPRAVELLRQARDIAGNPSADSLVFPTASGRPYSDMVFTALLRRLGYNFTMHGFRSSFRDWAGETTAHPRDAIEAALAHQLPDKTEAAYFRSDLFEKRRQLMLDWERHCLGGADGS